MCGVGGEEYDLPLHPAAVVRVLSHRASGPYPRGPPALTRRKVRPQPHSQRRLGDAWIPACETLVSEVLDPPADRYRTAPNALNGKVAGLCPMIESDWPSVCRAFVMWQLV